MNIQFRHFFPFFQFSAIYLNPALFLLSNKCSLDFGFSYEILLHIPQDFSTISPLLGVRVVHICRDPLMHVKFFQLLNLCYACAGESIN